MAAQRLSLTFASSVVQVRAESGLGADGEERAEVLRLREERKQLKKEKKRERRKRKEGGGERRESPEPA